MIALLAAPSHIRLARPLSNQFRCTPCTQKSRYTVKDDLPEMIKERWIKGQTRVLVKFCSILVGKAGENARRFAYPSLPKNADACTPSVSLYRWQPGSFFFGWIYADVRSNMLTR